MGANLFACVWWRSAEAQLVSRLGGVREFSKWSNMGLTMHDDESNSVWSAFGITTFLNRGRTQNIFLKFESACTHELVSNFVKGISYNHIKLQQKRRNC